MRTSIKKDGKEMTIEKTGLGIYQFGGVPIMGTFELKDQDGEFNITVITFEDE